MNKLTLTLVATVLSAGSIFAAVAINQAQMANVERATMPARAPQYPDVSVLNVTPADFQATISGHGEARASYQLKLLAEVSGRVRELSPKFNSGRQFSKNEILLTIEDTPYREALASAQSNLADAELALLQEERNSEQALAEWRRSGLDGEPASPLVLRKPQLKAAKAKVTQARQAVRKAQFDLDKTVIRAPFDAVVVSRDVQPGSYLQGGAQVAELYNTDVIEVAVPLSDSQWLSLPEAGSLAEQPWPVTLVSSDGRRQWQAKASRVEQHLDSQSRQRSLIVTVEQPLAQTPALFPGTFVSAEIQGRQLHGLWQLPSSAISQDGDIWYLTDDSTLAKFEAEVLFAEGDAVYIAPLAGVDRAAVVTRPLSSYLLGMKVTAKTGEKA